MRARIFYFYFCQGHGENSKKMFLVYVVLFLYHSLNKVFLLCFFQTFKVNKHMVLLLGTLIFPKKTLNITYLHKTINFCF